MSQSEASKFITRKSVGLHGGRDSKFLYIISFFLLLYLFFLSITAMQMAFKGFGAGFSTNLLTITDNPLVGLFVGILATSLIQSSSTTTSLVVALVASGAIDVRHAIPVVMGANIGTSVTNTLVSMGHITRSAEFRRAFGAAVVHDFFNLMAVIFLLPLEIVASPLERTAEWLGSVLTFHGAGMSFSSPLKAITKPVVHGISAWIENGLGDPWGGIALLVFGLVTLFLALGGIVNVMRKIFMGRFELVFNRFVGSSALVAMLLGAICTAIVQSSSVTTSLLVPMAGAGIITIRQVFPITLGANVGTTVTALLAAMAVDSSEAAAASGLIVALTHFLFNVTGIMIIYPFEKIRKIPINMARRLSFMVSKRRSIAFLYVLTVFFLVPLALIGITNFSGLLRLLGGK